MAADFPLSAQRRAWNRSALASLDRQFIETLLICITRQKVFDSAVLLSYFGMRPAVIMRVPPILFYLLQRKLRRAITPGAI